MQLYLMVVLHQNLSYLPGFCDFDLALIIFFTKMQTLSDFDHLQIELNGFSVKNSLVSMIVKASSVMTGPEPLIVFALK